MATNVNELNNDKAQEAVRFFTERHRSMDRARQPYYNNFEKDEKLFRSHIETSRKADWQSKYFIPRTYGLVMSSLSEFAINKPDVIVEPDTRGDATRVPYMQAVMHANWRKNRGNGELLYALLDALKLGIAIFEVGYRKESRKIKDIVNYDPATEDIEHKEKEIFDFDDVYFEAVNPRYFWVDESCNTISKANDCARLYIYSKEAFHRKFDQKFPKAKKVPVQGQITRQEFFHPFVGQGIGEGEIGVYKYINKGKDTTWWIANGVLLNDPEDPIPFHHKTLQYAEVKLAPYDKYTFYGLSLPRLVEDLQHEINTLRNMSVDQTHLNIFSPFFYSADEDLDESIFAIEPGIGIPVTDPRSFNFFKQQQVGPDAYNMSTKFDEDIRQATGFDLRLQGLPSGGTATETAILKETALKRINLYLRFLEELSLPDFSELWGDTLQQFYFTSSNSKTKKKRKKGSNEKEEIFRSIKIPKSDVKQFRKVETVGDYNFLEVTPKDIRGSFGFNTRIGTSISISKELDKQVKLQLYSIMAAEPLVKREKLVVDVLKSHELDPEEYMTVTQEVDLSKSIALAEEHNKQIIAGQEPVVIEELITPEHIQIHDALVKSGKLDSKTKQLAMNHVLKETRISKVSGVAKGGGAQQMQFPSVERSPGLTEPMSK
ncbi:MAG: hypothetical protein ACOC80_15990, partial [Petrotogales bacterium]